mmetsp:Transcript_5110/g.18347  ORF Transcript_5110/g.18347 Transcript_5110/m.18347 type:complete len:647 (-) Transcript_5110:1354-3294(-)
MIHQQAFCSLVLLVKICSSASPKPFVENRGPGGVLTWGRNNHGQLQAGGGIVNITTDVLAPNPLSNLPLSPYTNVQVVVTSVAAGDGHTLIATDEGLVYAVGANDRGQLGLGDLFDRPRFILLKSLQNASGALYNGVDFIASMGFQRVLEVFAGASTSGAVTEEGKLFVWGDGSKGQLGAGCAPFPAKTYFAPWDDITNFMDPTMDSGANQVPNSNPESARYVETNTVFDCYPYKRRLVPQLVEGLANTYISKAAFSKTFAAALTGMCGADRFSGPSCLPTTSIGNFIALPVLGTRSGNAQGSGLEMMLYAAGVQTCRCGEVYMWGDNKYGQLGTGDQTYRYTPTLVTSLSSLGIHISDIALGAFHVVALSSNGNVYTWGYNAQGQLGNGNTISQAYPVRVRKNSPGFLFVDAIAAGAYHSVYVNDIGELFSFGSNRDGQLGIGSADMLAHPEAQLVSSLPPLRGLMIDCGAYHCLAITTTLTFFTWGWNQFGQVGNGNTSSVFEPLNFTLPSSLPGFPIAIATGYSHNVIALQTGDLTYCGINEWGNTVCNRKFNFPTPVTTSTGGIWLVTSATASSIEVIGSDSQEFTSTGSIILYRNETYLGLFSYNAISLIDTNHFAFQNMMQSFPTGEFTPDAVWKTALVV